jgi:hypothetical protein
MNSIKTSIKQAAWHSYVHQSLSIEIPTNKQTIKKHSNMIHMDFLGKVLRFNSRAFHHQFAAWLIA